MSVREASSSAEPYRAPAAPAAGPIGQAGPRIRFWPMLVVLAAFWVSRFGAEWVEMTMFLRFITRMAAHAALLIALLTWWLTNRGVSRRDRWLGLLAFVVTAAIGAVVADKTIGPFLIVVGLPFVATGWVAWLMLTPRLALPARRIGLVVLMALTWGFFDLERWDGLWGGQQSQTSWRWSPTSEQLFLVERAQHKAKAVAVTAVASAAIVAGAVAPDDWPEFRGPQRDDKVHGVQIATDWQTAPPKKLWRQRIGPAWSSMAVIGNLLITQEQRGEHEAVVAYDATTGHELWAHEDPVRFYENLSGAGPRGTPTYVAGRIYSLGGTGLLTCVNAADGKAIWTRDIAAESGAKVPQWGYSNSPLVVDGVVVVYTDKGAEKGVLAFHAADGKPAWTAATGTMSYSSPQLVDLDGQRQLLMLSNRGLAALEPATGHAVWEYSLTDAGMFMPIAQPQVVGPQQILLPSPAGMSLVEVSRQGEKWTTAKRWESRGLKPTLNDFVVCDGAVYGFDDGICCCIDLKTGKRRWKAGRYGHGQLMLLADQKLLLVLSETGEVILVAVNPDKLDELGRFQALEGQGKTWNHPAIAHGRLYVRNAEEMACYDLGGGVTR